MLPGFFLLGMVGLNFSAVRFAETDYSDSSTTHRENQHIHSSPNETYGDVAVLTVAAAGVWPHQGSVEFEIRDFSHIHAVLCDVGLILRVIELEMHDLIVHLIKSRRNDFLRHRVRGRSSNGRRHPRLRGL
jgi:hypothetical protein